MKTRIIHTKIWRDDWFAGLPRDARELWLYLLTCERINMSGIFEVSDREILFDTSIGIGYEKDESSNMFTTRLERLTIAKESLEPKAVFYDGYVRIVNVDKFNNYRFSERNEKAYNRELQVLPENVRKYFKVEFTMEEFINGNNPKIAHTTKNRGIAEKWLGRKLEFDEVIHYVDGNPDNGSIANIVIMKEDVKKSLDNKEIKISDPRIIKLVE